MSESSKYSQNQTSLPTEMQETKQRFFVFIEKLEEKLKDLAEASIPELIEINNTDTDAFKRTYHRMKAAVLGQLESILKKAQDVQEEKITRFPLSENNRAISEAYYPFRNECYERYDAFDNLYKHYCKQIENTFSEDYEAKYQKILDEFEAIKDKFKCHQCGSPILLDKLYFTTTYITCPSCQTKNTFEPCSQAKMLEQTGKKLAEQRTRHLLKEHNDIAEKCQHIYMQRHNLTLSLIHEKDKTVITQKEKQIQELEQQQKELEQTKPALHQRYLRAMIDEWNAITPDLKTTHEKIYISLLTATKPTKQV